ncbi:MAG: chloride channel protein [Phenylobacterium sp.]|uniref:chloride channel protein n=1 Tax=Phenylobacterium sp. TaxID=1871053 RepID=UPI0025F30E92|nr:chloride channel protein [Phenylobacterium sp.]MBI1197298.1 chloride channel protein [Phenylobacterium sp.]
MIDLPPLPRPQPVRLLAALRRRLRSSELWLVALAVAVGAAAGLLAEFQAGLAHGMQRFLYGLSADARLSAQARIAPAALLWLPVGGLLLGAVSWLAARRRRAALVDVVEANALHGGVLGVVDSLIVCGQTLISNGFGASVGLEAAYAQAGGATASVVGQRLRLRRHDLRIMLGAGAGAAIAAAFGAPLTGAFYAFEIVIGSYTPSAIAPVAAACLAAVLTAKAVGGASYRIDIHPTHAPDLTGYLLFAGLGLVCALVGIAIVLLVGRMERAVRASPIPPTLRPAVGGALLAGVALLSPQALSAGHGALHVDLLIGLPLALLALIFALKTAGSVISLGFGFRGGLFFASLFLGSLVGQIYAGAVDLAFAGVKLSPENAALVGMGALGVAVVGGPLTMSFLVLESTRDFGVAAATLAAALIASTVVRERFGYSFSTWRLHLRGETIRSARDVGWMRTLTAERMMRRDVQRLPDDATVADFRRRIPLGSTSRVILEDAAGRYAGLVITAQAYAEGLDPEAPVASVAISQDLALSPDMDVAAVMRTFEATETEELPVIDADRRVLGLLAEAYATRRYAHELERRHLELFGEARS